jgi:hypothetical protein
MKYLLLMIGVLSFLTSYALAAPTLCFERSFSKRILSLYPGRIVNKVFFSLTKMEGAKRSSGKAILLVQTTDHPGRSFVNSGVCEQGVGKNTAMFRCQMDGDGGAYTIEFLSRRTLVLELETETYLFDPALGDEESELDFLTLDPGKKTGSFQLKALSTNDCGVEL